MIISFQRSQVTVLDPLTFGFIVNKSIALAVSNLISRSVGGVFSGRSKGVMFSLLTVDTDATSVFGETRPLSIGGECVLLDEVSREIAEFPCSTHV